MAVMLPHSTLAFQNAYRSVLRNLKLLSGMRMKENFEVLIAGYDVSKAAEQLSALEPSLRITVVGDEHGVHESSLAPYFGKDFDAAIYIQPYHLFKGAKSGGMSEWKAIRACLHDDDGALGMMWTRAAPQKGWHEAFTAGATRHGQGRIDLGEAHGLLPGLQPEQTPMTWMDTLDFVGTGYKPVKHRKFVESIPVKNNPTLLPLLRCVHDARFRVGQDGSCSEFDAGVAHASKAMSTSELDRSTLLLDLHCFHTMVVPVKVKTPRKIAQTKEKPAL